MNRILIIGASGSGTTTVGKNLAAKLQIPHVDTDDLFWLPADLPFTKFRSQPELDEILKTELILKDRWVLSGSPCGWGDIIIAHLNLVVFLTVPTEIRIERIKKREQERFGKEILEDGKLYQSHLDFLDWTAHYNTGNIAGRTKTMHENWLKNLPCPVLRFEGETDSNQILTKILNYVKSHN